MTKKEMKDIDIEISDKVEPTPETKQPDLSVEKFMKVLEAIDWKLWEMLQIMEEWNKEDKED